MLVENRKLEPTLPLFGAPVGVTPLEFCRDFSRQKTRIFPSSVESKSITVEFDFKFESTAVEFGFKSNSNFNL